MRFILELYQYSTEDRGFYFLKKDDYEELFSVLANRRELKDFRKAEGQELLMDAESKPFPRRLL